jgi:hypothetical protein
VSWSCDEGPILIVSVVNLLSGSSIEFSVLIALLAAGAPL